MRVSLLCICSLLMVAGLMIPGDSKAADGAGDSKAPQYTADGKLIFPANYREWIYLTTGMDMDYNPELQTMDHSMFDNIFVNPEAYKAFVATGTWPDKTILVLEGRMAQNKGSINQKGHFQTTDIMARSIHIKDAAHFPGGWAFVGFGDSNTGKLSRSKRCAIPATNNMRPWIRRLCSSTRRCWGLRKRRARCLRRM